MNAGSRLLVAVVALLLAAATHGQATAEPSDEDSATNDRAAVLDCSGCPDSDGKPFIIDSEVGEDEPAVVEENLLPPGPMTLIANSDWDIHRNKRFLEDQDDVSNETTKKIKVIKEEARQSIENIPGDLSTSEQREKKLAIINQRDHKIEEAFSKRKGQIAELEEKFCADWQVELSFRAQLHRDLSEVCDEVLKSPHEVCIDEFKQNVARRGGAYIVKETIEDRAVRATLPGLYYVYRAVDTVTIPSAIVNEVIAPPLHKYGNCTRAHKRKQRNEFCPDARTAGFAMKNAQGTINRHCSEG